jgi:hypothetical protein
MGAGVLLSDLLYIGEAFNLQQVFEAVPEPAAC